MIARTPLAIASLTALALAAALPASAQAASTPGDVAITAPYVEGQLIVGFNPGTPAAAQAAALDTAGAQRSEQLTPLAVNDRLVRLGAGRSVGQALAALRNNPNVRYADPDYIVTTQATSNDTYFTNGTLWGMYGDASTPSNSFGSQAAEAWAAGQTGKSSTYVVVIDEGIQVTHPDLAGNTWTNEFDPVDGIDNDKNGFVDDVNGWDFVNNDSSVYDSTGDDHATHVAGTIGGIGGNGAGVAGVNWDVTMISAKFLGANGGSTSNAIKAVDYATDLKTRHGLDIVATSNSWGGGGFTQGLLDAINRGGSAGILFIAAAGNSGTNNDTTASYPSNYVCTGGGFDCVVAVAAIDKLGALASFSQYGATTVDLGAPGVSIQSTLPFNTYGSYSGTSMATPHVSGAAALCASADPAKRGSTLKSALLSLTTPTASLSGKTVTGGRLDLSRLTSVCGGTTTGPAVYGLSPSSGGVGTTITISGSGLTGAIAKFGGLDVTENSSTDGTTVTFAVPAGSGAGTYPVTVTAGGTTLTAGSFTVVDVPSQPQNLTHTKVNRSTVRLSWTAPASGGPITKYEVRFSTSSTWTSTTSTSITARVRAGTPYTWSVRAWNAAGPGPEASDSFTFN